MLPGRLFRLSFLAALALAAGAATGQARDQSAAVLGARFQNVTLLGHANPGGGYTGDVYAHRGHAYLSSWRGRTCPAPGVRVFSLANPRRPLQVSTFADAVSEPALARTWTEKTIVKDVRTPTFSGTLAVTSVQGCDSVAFRGFALYDVTDPARPRQLALVKTDPSGSHEIWLAARGNRAYVYTAIPNSELISSPDYDPAKRTATIPGLPDFRIFDVSDPVNPVEVGSWGAWKELGVHPNSAQARGRYPRNLVHSVVVNPAATRAYLSYWDLGTVILDVSNPAAPRYVGRTRLPASEPEGDAHSIALARNGKLLVETHETFAGVPSFFDISNERKPRFLGNFRLPRAGRPGPGGTYYSESVHDAKVRGNLAFFSWYRQGAVVADITNPRKPRLVGHFVPPATADPEGGVCASGPCVNFWGVFALRDYVLASDMVGGLWVFKVKPPKKPKPKPKR